MNSENKSYSGKEVESQVNNTTEADRSLNVECKCGCSIIKLFKDNSFPEEPNYSYRTFKEDSLWKRLKLAWKGTNALLGDVVLYEEDMEQIIDFISPLDLLRFYRKPSCENSKSENSTGYKGIYLDESRKTPKYRAHIAVRTKDGEIILEIMGVDYSANFGVGIQVVRQDFDEDHEYYEDFLGWLDEQLEGWAYESFEVGSSSYGGGEDDVYVCFKNPFMNGYDLEASVQEFLAFLRINKIEYKGKVDVVGGLRIH